MKGKGNWEEREAACLVMPLANPPALLPACPKRICRAGTAPLLLQTASGVHLPGTAHAQVHSQLFKLQEASKRQH